MQNFHEIDFIRPVCLPTAGAALPPLADGTNLTVVGWGLTENGKFQNNTTKIQYTPRFLSECYTYSFVLKVSA